jgi:signal transduction histidine kinase
MRTWLRVVLLAVYLAAFGITARLLVSIDDRSLLPWYIALLVVFFALFSLVWVRPHLRPPALHLVFVLQCLIVLALLAFEPEFDYVTAFFALLTYQAAVVFRGWPRRIWIATLVALVAGSLMVARGPAVGLGLALTTMAFSIAMAALATASQEIEAARSESVDILGQLEKTNAELKKHAAEVDELAALQERNRLARELHDSVSQAMFSILLAVRSAQLMREREPESVQAQLELLQELSKDALARMRLFITDLRPKS